MKTLKNFGPLVLGLLPQLFCQDFLLFQLLTIGCGVLAGFLWTGKRIFLSILALQLVFFSLLYIFTAANIDYLGTVFANLQLPALLLPLVIILFNTLNVSILFYLGYQLSRLFRPRPTSPI